MIITLDGPTASGKSTVARLLAQTLGFYYINTGLLYRAVAYILIQQKKYNFEMLAYPLGKDLLEVVNPEALKYFYAQQPTILFHNQDITAYLKDVVIDKGASIISSVPYVRELLLDFQRHIAHYNNVVVEGRDTGSVVFPHADYKFYITADLSVRAQRWFADQTKFGHVLTHDEAIACITERDKRDSERSVAPLIIPEQAVVIDTSYRPIKEVLQEILSIITG